jgi:hypothetical protein
MSNAINALDKEDQENLQFILQKMYPESKNFKELLPTVKTLELYMQAVSANNFCNKAMTQLTTELLSASVSQIYKGRLKQVVKKVLKEIKGHYQKNNFNFFICNQVVKYKYKSPLVISLHGFY